MRVRRLPLTDRVDRDGESVVLVGHTVVRLSPVATVLLDRCEAWTDLDVLTDQVVAALGPAPQGVDPRRAVGSAAEALVAQGLLERG